MRGTPIFPIKDSDHLYEMDEWIIIISGESRSSHLIRFFIAKDGCLYATGMARDKSDAIKDAGQWILSRQGR